MRTPVSATITTLVPPAITLAQVEFLYSPMRERRLTRSSMNVSTNGSRTPLATCETRITCSSGRCGIRTNARAEDDQRGVEAIEDAAPRWKRRLMPDSKPSPSQML